MFTKNNGLYALIKVGDKLITLRDLIDTSDPILTLKDSITNENVNCTVLATFEIEHNHYIALLPHKVDESQNPYILFFKIDVDGSIKKNELKLLPVCGGSEEYKMVSQKFKEMALDILDNKEK